MLETVAAEAVRPKDQRRGAAMRVVLSSFAETIEVGASLTTLWERLGPTITSAFYRGSPSMINRSIPAALCVAGCSLALPSRAQACGCGGGAPLSLHVNSATTVFVGTVEAVTGGMPLPIVATFSVGKAYRWLLHQHGDNLSGEEARLSPVAGDLVETASSLRFARRVEGECQGLIGLA